MNRLFFTTLYLSEGQKRKRSKLLVLVSTRKILRNKTIIIDKLFNIILCVSYLLGRAPQARLIRPNKLLEVVGFPKRVYGASIPTKAISTTIPTKRSAAYNSNSAQKSFPLF